MTYTLEQLAEMFAVTPRTLSNKLPDLMANKFPAKLPGSIIWSKPQVDYWIATNGGQLPDPRQPPSPQSENDHLAQAAALLDQEYVRAS